MFMARRELLGIQIVADLPQHIFGVLELLDRREDV